MPKPPNPGLTRRQKQLYEYLVEYQERHGSAPTFAEMGAVLGGSTSTLHAHREALIEKGYIVPAVSVTKLLRSGRVSVPSRSPYHFPLHVSVSAQDRYAALCRLIEQNRETHPELYAAAQPFLPQVSIPEPPDPVATTTETEPTNHAS